MICSVCRKPVTTDESVVYEAHPTIHTACAPVRRLIGYRVVRERNGVREWMTWDGAFTSFISSAFLHGVICRGAARRSARASASADARVVAVYLTVKPRGGAR